jgi:hypothetical protein
MVQAALVRMPAVSQKMPKSLRLVSAICVEISEDWESGKVYLDIKEMRL